MTEREKMLAGELYSPKDPELRKMHLRSKKLFGKYNKTNPENEKKLNKLIKYVIVNSSEFIIQDNYLVLKNPPVL